MSGADREFERLARRYQQLFRQREVRGPATGELAGCQDRLLEHVRDRDRYGREALGVVLGAALDDLVFFIHARVHDHGHAEDLAQDVLTAVLKAYERGSRLQLAHGSSSFFEYLYTAARREAARHLRQPVEDLEVLAAPEDLPALDVRAGGEPAPVEFHAGSEEFWRWVDQARRHLPPAVTELVFLAFRTGLSGAELAKAVGLRPDQNIAMYKKRACATFVDWFAVLWVARTRRGGAGGCARLGDLLSGWRADDQNSFTPEIYRLVRGHVRGCAGCHADCADFKGANDSAEGHRSANVLAKFRTLPVLAASEPLRRWLELQTGEDRRERRRAVIEIVTSWPWRRNSRAQGADGVEVAGTTTAAATAGAALPVRLAQEVVARVQAAAASVARLPSGLTEMVQNSRALSGGAATVLLVIAGVAALAGSEPGDPQARRTPSPSPTVSAEPATAPVAATAQPSGPPVAPGEPAPGPGPGDPTGSGTGNGSGGGGADPSGSPTASPQPPPPAGTSTTFDMTALHYDFVTISNVGSWKASEVHTFQLNAGSYMLSTVGNGRLAFSVDEKGVVDYDSSLGYVSGRGTRTLKVTGIPMIMDGSALSYSHIALSGTIWMVNVRHTVRLLPGTYTFYGAGATGFKVTLRPDATIDYDLSLWYVSGRGTNILTVTGLPVTVDATAMGSVKFGLTPATGWLDALEVQRLRVLPGSYTFYVAHVRSFAVKVTPGGTFDYDSGLTGVSGQGTAALAVS